MVPAQTTFFDIEACLGDSSSLDVRSRNFIGSETKSRVDAPKSQKSDKGVDKYKTGLSPFQDKVADCHQGVTVRLGSPSILNIEMSSQVVSLDIDVHRVCIPCLSTPLLPRLAGWEISGG